MNSTITGFTDTAAFNSYYTVDYLNDVFTEIARVLNNKVDTRDPYFMDIDLGGQRIINMGEGNMSTDAITLGQLKEVAELGKEFPTGLLPGASDKVLEPLGPIREPIAFEEFTDEDTVGTLNRNVVAALGELSHKLKVGSDEPFRKDATALNTRVTNVGKAVDDTDAATFENALEIVNGTL